MLREHVIEGLYFLEIAEKGRRTKLKSKMKRYKVLSIHVNKIELRAGLLPSITYQQLRGKDGFLGGI